MADQGQMSRGDMIRRLDEATLQVRDQLGNGPLTADERQHLAEMLEALLPIVAGSLQDQIDQEAANALLLSLHHSAAARALGEDSRQRQSERG